MGIGRLIIPQRGEVWLVDLDPTKGAEIQKKRPAVVLSTPGLYGSAVRIVVPITTWQPKFARFAYGYTRLQAAAANGLLRESAAVSAQIRAVALERFLRKMGTLTTDEAEEIAAAVALCIDYRPVTL